MCGISTYLFCAVKRDQSIIIFLAYFIVCNVLGELCVCLIFWKILNFIDILKKTNIYLSFRWQYGDTTAFNVSFVSLIVHGKITHYILPQLVNLFYVNIKKLRRAFQNRYMAALRQIKNTYKIAITCFKLVVAKFTREKQQQRK